MMFIGANTRPRIHCPTTVRRKASRPGAWNARNISTATMIASVAARQADLRHLGDRDAATKAYTKPPQRNPPP